MEPQQSQQIKRIIDLIFRRKKIIISFVLIAIFAGLAVYLKTPKVYQSTALLIYERGKISTGNKATPVVTTETREMVATLTQQVTSRTSLEAIIKQFDLYAKERQKLPMEDVVDWMRARDISIKPDKGDVFKVSFSGAEPKKVLQVANALAARFIEENLRYREEKATETSAYVRDELQLAKATLDKKEEVMRDYKLQYYNEMPQQLTGNLARLSALQTQLQLNRTNLQELERTKVMIQEQISTRKAAAEQFAQQAAGRAAALPASKPAVEKPVMSELALARQQLAALLERFTESHPDVRRAQKKVAALESSSPPPVKEVEGPPDENKGGGADGSRHPPEVAPLFDNQLAQLETQLKQTDLARESRNQENLALQKQIDKYEKWLSMTPVREAEWTALTRDYEQLNNNYQHLVAQNLEAGAAESLERRQKGSQFKIVDSAYLPEKPVTPDFKKIMLLALALGLGLGGGLAFLLELQDSSFREVAEVESYLGLPVICAIPLIISDNDRRTSRRRSLAWLAFFLLALALLLAGVTYLLKTGRIIV